MGVNRRELAALLRRARERVQPGDVGLPSGSRRRTPGLRREEVAMLAGISADYVVRLEQARGPTPSDQVLGALARALRMDLPERDELFLLAGQQPPGLGTVRMHVRPSVLRLIDRFADLPAVVLSAKGDVLAWNAMSAALHGDWSALAPERRNLLRLQFLPDAADPPFSAVGSSEEERADTAARAVADLRAAAARYPDDTALQDLVADLRGGSPRFAELWDSGVTGGWRTHTKTIRHHRLGPLRLECDSLHVPDDDQAVVVYSAAPGSPEAEALALLRVVGTQDLANEDLANEDWAGVVRR